MYSATDEKIIDKVFSPDEIKGAEFTSCNFIKCHFPNMLSVKFYDCNFSRCNFANSNLHDSQFQNCNFHDSKLLGVGISRNNFAFSANFFSCDLRYVEFIELYLRGMKIENSNCEAIRFSNCDLREVDFSKCNFKDAIFNRCDLQKAKLSHNTFLVIDPAANKIKHTEIDMETAVNVATIFGFKIE